ncbi:helix-turn-helix domain-containing protein [Alicyclobacillus dauci]|uniref:Helix-turn-helix domain-containing protein n=1 Tax=Alicyclobacillus dauci TaxID=1475485 RepID=A0ABY6YXC9_9BACL|nr:helix-turn-helix domain-containing protein [Alicyclobacillus dauci]WAH35002.1 helix-turn-helix domain-containing protein [Alicyclobacillus dauci]
MEREDFPHTLTPKQVKEFMNIGINQVYELIRTRSDLPKFYIGRSPRIPRDAFFRWYDERWMSNEKLEVEV